MIKKNIWKTIYNYVLIVVGCFLLAVGYSLFLNPLGINSGGLDGIGLIVNSLANVLFKTSIDLVTEITIACFSVGLWIFGFIVLGKQFAIKTLLSTILFPGFMFLLRFGIFPTLTYSIIGDYTEIVARTILMSVFGGVFVGSGVAISFIAGGSTGGLDTILFVLEDKFGLKQSIGSFMVDGSIILVGLITNLCIQTPEFDIATSLCGILTAFVSAILIEAVYISSQTSYQVDIISDRWEDISRYAQDVLGRGCTIIPCKGGYQGADRVILRVVFSKREYEKLRTYISHTDPKAFITFTQTNAVYGEGFKNNKEKNG